MGRKPKKENQRKVKQIKINVTISDFERFNIKKNRLLEHSPTLRVNDILRKVINNIDDTALIQFLNLDKNDIIRIKLKNDFMMSQLTNS